LVLGSSILTYDKQGRLFDSLSSLGLMGFGVAGFVGLWLVVSILRSGRFR
jgi:ubiquinone biosynthesis protein